MDWKTGGVNPPAHGPRKAVVGHWAGGPANGAWMSIASSVAQILEKHVTEILFLLPAQRQALFERPRVRKKAIADGLSLRTLLPATRCRDQPARRTGETRPMKACLKRAKFASSRFLVYRTARQYGHDRDRFAPPRTTQAEFSHGLSRRRCGLPEQSGPASNKLHDS